MCTGKERIGVAARFAVTIMVVTAAIVAAAVPESRADRPVWQGFRRQRRISGLERQKVLREQQQQALREMLAAVPRAQQDQLIVWFQRYQGRLIEDEAAWQAQVPFLRQMAVDGHLSPGEKHWRLKQHLAEQSRAYERARVEQSNDAVAERNQ